MLKTVPYCIYRIQLKNPVVATTMHYQQCRYTILKRGIGRLHKKTKLALKLIRAPYVSFI